MNRTRSMARRHCRRLEHRQWRRVDRPHSRCLPGFTRGPDYVMQAIAAFRRALRAHRRLARLAPSQFDYAVVERERQQREEQRHWLASWEPALRKVYGQPSPSELQADSEADRPPKLHPRTQRAMEREWANWSFWIAEGDAALQRYRRRRPHALLSFGQVASLLDIGFAFSRLACGLDSTQPATEPSWENRDWEADLKRAYGQARDAP